MAAPASIGTRVRGLGAAALVVAALLGGTLPSLAQDAASRGDAEMAEAKQFFDALDYEHAVPALDRALAILEPLAAEQPATRAALIGAYEMRARARFGLGDRDGAVADFKALLGYAPAFSFPAHVSPRVVSLLDEVRKETIGTLTLTVDPPDASIELNGSPFTPAAEGVPLKAGEYSVKATRFGYKPLDEKAAVTAGESRQLGLVMERTSAAVFLLTSPAEVEVLVDGTSRGRTAPGPPPPQYAEVVSQLGVAPDTVSSPLVLSDLPPGTHAIQFKRDCHVTEDRRLVIENLADYRVDPVRLRRAVATLSIESVPAGASVFVDGEPRGAAPVTLDDVCEGQRLVELRGPQGRYVRRLAVRTGDQMQMQGTLKPAFALLPAGAGASMSGASDVRTVVERALAASQQVTLFVPDDGALEDAGRSELPPPEWLAFDSGRRPVGGAAAISASNRRELSARLSKALDVQGVAAVTQPTPSSPELVISLLAAGAGEPDVVSILPERVDSVSRATARFDFVPPLSQTTIGVMAVDIVDGNGVVVARVDPGSAGTQAGLTAGDVITKIDGQSTAVPGTFQRALDERRAGDRVTLEVVDRAGATRTVPIQVQQRPRVISPSDQTLLFNPLAVALRSRLATADSSEAPVVRLNLGVALMHLGDYAGAREQFEAVQLPDGPGVSSGTQQYLLGLAYEGLGDSASAQKAWQAAAKTDALLTEDGPAVRGLAERKLGARAASGSEEN